VYFENKVVGRISKIGLPHTLRNRMVAADGSAVIEKGTEGRLDVLLEDYATELGGRFAALTGEEREREEHSGFLRE